MNSGKSLDSIWLIDTIFMNSEKIKTSDAQRVLLNLSDKINLKTSDKYNVLSNLCTHGKT